MIALGERETVLRRALAPLRDDYDYILIDCPPSLGLLTLNVLTAADGVVIPIQCEYYALEGISQLLNTIRIVQQNFNPDFQIDGVLLTMFDARLNLSRQVVAEAREYFGAKVFRTVIPRNVRLAEAPSFGKPILLYDVQSVGAKSYLAVAQELMKRTEALTRTRRGTRNERIQEARPRSRGAARADLSRTGRGQRRAPRNPDPRTGAEPVPAAAHLRRRCPCRARRLDRDLRPAPADHCPAGRVPATSSSPANGAGVRLNASDGRRSPPSSATTTTRWSSPSP